MLNKNDLLESVDEKYVPMLKEVNIPDFTKCIAQFSGLRRNEVKEDVIKEYLLTWAKNKHRFYKMLGNKLKVDNRIQYKDENIEVYIELKELGKDFPAFALWLEGFRWIKTNKFDSGNITIDTKNVIERIFPDCKINGCLMTHFFKKYLKAPDELVTKIGRIWEHEMIEGKYTISIDPVDMMLASENPYDWTSCYKLESSHADGCLAAILDDSSLITYVWNREGKFSLYNQYDFKNIRYYRMRQWISISPKETAIHFNAIYPGKRYSDEFEKKLRLVVEDFINKEATWVRNTDYRTNCKRTYLYGYNEYDYENIYKIKDSSEYENWDVYNEQILCPCGCGEYMHGSDEYDDDEETGYEYNGNGFIAENFEEVYKGEYCGYIDDYCRDYGEYCENCYYWRRDNPVCELDKKTQCAKAIEENIDEEYFDPTWSNIVKCGGHCEDCMYYDIHKKDKEDSEN